MSKPTFPSRLRRTDLPLRDFAARQRARFARARGGRFPYADADAAVNLSYVLHERSNSATVASAVRAASRIERIRRDIALVCDGDPNLDVDCWIIPSVGYPERLGEILGAEKPVHVMDCGREPLSDCMFFRAPARLTLPDNACGSVGVAALIRRPGARSLQLICRGPFLWLEARDDAVRTMESIVRAHVEQWRPGSRLWARPAEEVLPEFQD